MRLLIFLFTMTCAMEAFSEAPSWTKDHNRKVIGGDIVYLGVGEHKDENIASFKAENEAIKRLLLECQLPHRNIRIIERHQQPQGSGYKAFAQASLSFSNCEEAKRAKGKRAETISNKKIEHSQALYESLIKKEIEVKKSSTDLESLVRDIHSTLKKDNYQTNQRLDSIERKIESIQSSPKTVVVKKSEIHVHGTEAKYQECLEDYNDLMDEAQMEANESGVPRGNLASGKAMKIFNKAQRKLYRCQKIKRSVASD